MHKFTNLLELENAGITMRQDFKPLGGEDDAVIFPPTYATLKKTDIFTYIINEVIRQDGTVENYCTIDSVGSQANRMEPIFKGEPYKSLIPEVIVSEEKTGQETNILEAGHRVADAILRFSDLSEEITKVFNEIKRGNYEPLAKIAPTSLVFGVWDSRDTRVQIPRIVKSIIRAKNVTALKRSAQYVPAIPDYKEALGKLTPKEIKDLSVVGMANVPSTGKVGGVQITGDSSIFRKTELNLSVLRQAKVRDSNNKINEEATVKLQNYLLSLSLIAFFAPQDYFLRMGCTLTGDPEKPTVVKLITRDGTKKDLNFTPTELLNFANDSAEKFGVGEPRYCTFDKSLAKKALAKKDKGNL